MEEELVGDPTEKATSGLELMPATLDRNICEDTKNFNVTYQFRLKGVEL